MVTRKTSSVDDSLETEAFEEIFEAVMGGTNSSDVE